MFNHLFKEDLWEIEDKKFQELEAIILIPGSDLKDVKCDVVSEEEDIKNFLE